VTVYPKIEEVLVAHELLIEVFGGSAGIRDRGALEAALARPQAGYYQDVIQEAAALWESLSQNHPFIDGNKRVAAAFLRVNGYRLDFDDLDAFSAIIGLYETSRMRFREVEEWLRQHVSLR
jgi:death-on-curing protein